MVKLDKSGGSENLRFDKNLKPLTNLDLLELVELLEIKNFRGVFMRDTLPQELFLEETLALTIFAVSFIFDFLSQNVLLSSRFKPNISFVFFFHPQ